MRWLRLIASPIALIYGLVVYLRNFLYDIGFLKSNSFSTPTICVGNLSLGGTGKTPMIDYLLTTLKSDYKIAVLSRGYKRKSEGFQLADSHSNAEILGDEPYQLFKKHPDVTVAVDANRSEGIVSLEELDDFDLILLDDAFQHRKVKSSFSILLTTFENPYPKDFYIPVGRLRDAKNQSKRSDVIIVTKCPSSLTQSEQLPLKDLIKPKINQDLFFTSFQYAELFTDGTKALSFEELAAKNCVLVTGIAKPEPLVTHLHSKNLNLEHLKFADHSFFSNDDIKKFSQYDIVLTTEKDFARLEGRLENVYYLSVAHKFFDEGEELLLERIRGIFKPA